MVYLLSCLCLVAQAFSILFFATSVSAIDIPSVIISSDIPSKELGKALFAQK